jgi:phosphoribosylformylglycinamidine (FGAM) synthase-like enzyme
MKKQNKKSKMQEIKDELQYRKVMFKADMQKAINAAKIIMLNALIPALIIMMALTLLGFEINIMNYAASVCLYFITEEIKAFFINIKK